MAEISLIYQEKKKTKPVSFDLWQVSLKPNLIVLKLHFPKTKLKKCLCDWGFVL